MTVHGTRLTERFNGTKNAPETNSWAFVFAISAG